MKTYLTVWFDSEGGRPSEVTKGLKELGFEPVRGNYDFEYKWDNDAPLDEILRIGDKVQSKLKDKEILFTLETV